MARLSAPNVERARSTIALYPHARSALIPLLHLAQEQDGWVDEAAMQHIAELLVLELQVFVLARFNDISLAL